MSEVSQRYRNWNDWMEDIVAVAVRRPKPTFPARGTIAAILDEMDERISTIREDPDLSQEDKRRLLKSILQRVQVDLGQLAGVAGADQTLLAEALAEVATVTCEPASQEPTKPWWAFWIRALR